MQKQPFNTHAHTPSATCMRAGAHAHAHNNTTPLPLSPYCHSSPLPLLLQPSPSWPCHERAMWRSIPPGTSTLAVPTLPRLAAANWKDRGNRQAGRQQTRCGLSPFVRLRVQRWFCPKLGLPSFVIRDSKGGESAGGIFVFSERIKGLAVHTCVCERMRGWVCVFVREREFVHPLLCVCTGARCT